ncbi:hypothetical protein [Sphingomonas echinoides]|uniref:DUF3168 domain-containing protein n=1 Tax=Sphingomonas echinoides TaxID=59803 RepID=A0ABU4PKI8_9SPHN|nr:hypothetical protein [Sphingomonas echinoides]MDX5984695.1 hypothetical protein [Sphingomonas echinoides]
MTDLLGAARGAFFRALNEGASGQIAPVFTEVPQDTQPNFYKIGMIESDPGDAKPDDMREELLVEIIVVYRGEDRGQLLTMMEAARSDLRGKPITAPGAKLRPPRWAGSTSSDAMPDGVTYVGLLHFTLHAQPA